MTVEQLISRYMIKQHSEYKDGEGWVYTDNILIHNGNLAKKENMIPVIRERKQEILDYFNNKREKERLAYEDRQRRIDAIEGLKEIEAAMEDLDRWHDEFEKSFEDVGGLGVRPKPEYDFDAMYEKYPVAKAYLDAYNYSNKSHYELSAIGKRALDRIIYHPEDYKEALEQMKADLDEFTAEHAWD